MTHVPQPQRRIDGLDRRIIGDEGHNAALLDPVQQRFVVAVECCTRRLHHMRVRLLVGAHQIIAIAGVDQQEVTLLDQDILLLQHLLHLVHADQRPTRAELAGEIDQHAAALHAGGGHLFDAELVGGGSALRGGEHIDAGAKTVVVHRHFHPAPIHVEHPAPMRERIPLRGILQAHGDTVVAADVLAGECEIIDLVAEQLGGPQLGAEAPGVGRFAARQIERQAEREGLAFLDLGDGGEAHLRGDGAHAAEFVVRPEITPVGAFGAARPALIVRMMMLAQCRHLPPSTCDLIAVRCGRLDREGQTGRRCI